MPSQHKPYKVYRAFLRLYPKSHREEYSEQMVQTLDDILSERHRTHEKIAVWLRISRELPLNIVEEHINNLEEMKMGKLAKLSGGQIVAIALVSMVVIITLGIALRSNNQFSPATLAQVKSIANPPACVQKEKNTSQRVDENDAAFIGNVVATSIIDVPAGTNVDVHLKTYNTSGATGTAVYTGDYGNYNFVAKKTASNASDSYAGGWEITDFQACK